MRGRLEILAAIVAAVLIAGSVWMLELPVRDLVVSETAVGDTPVTVTRPASGPEGPVVVIAHGFAGSRQIMQSFTITLARNGYTAVSFDFQGHGRHPQPMRGDLEDERGATRNLLAELQQVIAFARTLTPAGRDVALVAHSMATDIVIRAAGADPDIVATVAVSMFSPALTAEVPRNLLVVAGSLESDRLKAEAVWAVSLTHGEGVEAGKTFGDFKKGTARRAAFAGGVEHVGVLFAGDTMRETLGWLDAAFEHEDDGFVAVRGPWIALLMLGIAASAWPASRLLPKVRDFPTGAAVGWGGVFVAAGVPAILTPLILWQAPTDFLDMIVGDYLIAHFALYGLLSALCLEVLGAQTPWGMPSGRVLAAAILATAFGIAAIALPFDRYFASFVPTGERAVLAALMTAATLPYFLVDDWLARGRGMAGLRLLVTRLLLLASLAGAVALNREDLFFLVILLPVIALFFLLYGVLSSLVYARTGHPGPGAMMSAAALAWSISVTFPILAGV